MNNKSLNIAIGKIGKSMKSKAWTILGSESAPIIFYSSLSKLNPQINFYIIGTNDIHKLNKESYDKLFPNHNVISCYEDNDLNSKYNDDNKYQIPYDYLIKNNIKLDAALIFSGMASENCNIPNFLPQKSHPELLSKPLQCFKNYAGNIIYVLNKTNVPLFTIAEDPRHIICRARDLYNRERLIFSQANIIDMPVEHIYDLNDLTKLTTSKLNAEYYHTEKIFLMGESQNWKNDIDINKKDGGLIMLMNGHGTSKLNGANIPDGRLPFVKEWVFDLFENSNFNDCIIYGKWSDELHKSDNRFICKPMTELKDELMHAKYTLIYSIQPGFVTVKPFEMIRWGIIPFLHPDYDPEHLLNFPDYLYIKDKHDLIVKIKYLEENQDEYKSLLNECLDLIKPSYIDGTFLNNIIVDRIYKELNLNYNKIKIGLNDSDKISRFSSGIIESKVIDNNIIIKSKELF